MIREEALSTVVSLRSVKELSYQQIANKLFNGVGNASIAKAVERLIKGKVNLSSLEAIKVLLRSGRSLEEIRELASEDEMVELNEYCKSNPSNCAPQVSCPKVSQLLEEGGVVAKVIVLSMASYTNEHGIVLTGATKDQLAALGGLEIALKLSNLGIGQWENGRFSVQNSEDTRLSGTITAKLITTYLSDIFYPSVMGEPLTEQKVALRTAKVDRDTVIKLKRRVFEFTKDVEKLLRDSNSEEEFVSFFVGMTGQSLVKSDEVLQ